MTKTTKDLIKSILISIGTAMTIFCIVCVVFDVEYGGSFRMEEYRFTKMVIGCLMVGLGFGVPTVVYKSERLPMPVKILIHMGTGCVIYTIVAYAVGWIGGAATMTQGIIIACIQLFVAFCIWGLFMRHYQKEAKQMNDRIQQMNR